VPPNTEPIELVWDGKTSWVITTCEAETGFANSTFAKG